MKNTIITFEGVKETLDAWAEATPPPLSLSTIDRMKKSGFSERAIKAMDDNYWIGYSNALHSAGELLKELEASEAYQKELAKL